ncbi:MAG: hypothetical protein ACTJIB_18190 [Pseudoalteromonas prydzensis]|jgi:hypothetical protein
MKIILIFLGVLLGIYLTYEYPHIARQVWDFSVRWFEIGLAFVTEKMGR